MKTFVSILAVTVILLTSGCQESGASAANSIPPTEPSLPREVSPPIPSPEPESDNDGVNMPDLTKAPDPIAQNLVQIAIKDLAERLQINVDQIRLASIEAVEWSDSSLGCPQMGVMYTQVITPGYKLILEANGKTYPYHTNDRERVVLCALRPGGEYFMTPTP